MTDTNGKLRSLFLATLLVCSVFAGTVGFAGTAAAANQAPEITQLYQDGSDVVVVFDDEVRQYSEASDLVAENFTIRRRDDTGRYFYNVDSSRFSVTSEANGARYRISGWPAEGSPAADIKVSVDGVRPASTATGTGEYTTSFDNVTVEIPSQEISVLDGDHATRGDAARVYQGELLNLASRTDDQKLDIVNVETGEVLLDGSTGDHSKSLRVDTNRLQTGSTYKVQFEEGAKDGGAIRARPGTPGTNEFTFEIDLSEETSDTQVDRAWIKFNRSDIGSNPSYIDVQGISANQVDITGDNVDPGVGGIWYSNKWRMLVGFNSGFKLSDESGTLTVTVSGVDAPEEVVRRGRIALANGNGEQVATTDNYEIVDVSRTKYFNVTDLGLEAAIDKDGHEFTYDEELPVSAPGDVNFTYNVSGEAIRGDSDLLVRTYGPKDGAQWEDTANRTRLDNRAEFDEEVRFLAPDGARGYYSYSVEVIDVQTGVSVTAGEFTVADFPTADSAAFGGGVFEEERGDVVEIPITLADSEPGAQATVTIGDHSETNYVTNVTVADENGDGEVVLEWNTYMSGSNVSERIFTAQGNDTVAAFGGEHGAFVRDLREVAADSGRFGFSDAANAPDADIRYASVATLDAASYDLEVVANDEPTDEFDLGGADADAVGAVSINSRATESSQVWVVPTGTADQVDLGFIDENTDNTADDIDGNLTRTELATEDELIVHQISGSGLEGIIRNRTDAGANATSAFLSEVDTGVFEASFAEEDPGPNAERETFDLNTDNTVVLPDYENDTYYVAVDLAGVDESVLEDGIVYNASFSFAEYDAIGPVLGGEGGGGVDSVWTYETAEASLQTNAEDEVVVRNEAGQTLRGETNVAPGTELGLRVNSQSDTSPFLTTLKAVVDENRTFVATGDFSERGAGVNFTVNVRRGGDRIGGPYDGRILGQATASATFADQRVAETTQEVVVDSVTLSDGGFVAIHSGSASGDVIGTSRYLAAGSHSDVRIDLDTPIDETTTLVAMPHLDDDSDNRYDFPSADAPYTSAGAPVTDSASVSVGDATPTPTATATESPTPTATATATATPTETEATDTTEPTPTTSGSAAGTDAEAGDGSGTTADGGPGFGVAVSLVALLAAVLLAARRRD